MLHSGHSLHSYAARLPGVLALCVAAAALSGCVAYEGGGYGGAGYHGDGYYGGGYHGGRSTHYVHAEHGRSYSREHRGSHHAEPSHHRGDRRPSHRD